jgi:hypothetical protein
MDWNTDFSANPAREEYHRKKMISKDERPEKQLRISNIPPGKIIHSIMI